MLLRITFLLVALVASAVNVTDDGRDLVVTVVGEPTWILHENAMCGEGTVAGEEADSWEAAKARCEEMADSCFGVYDIWCQGNLFFLCDLQDVQAAEDLDFSQSGSCVRQLMAAPTPAPDGGGEAAGSPSPTFEPSPAPTALPAPATLGTTPTADAIASGARGSCWENCTLPAQTDARTCWEQIMRYGTAPSSGSSSTGSMPLDGWIQPSTGSMPEVEIPCAQRRMLVSHAAECQVCSTCHICENSTSMAAFMVTGAYEKVSAQRASEAAAAGRSLVSGTSRRAVLLAAAATTAGVAALAAALRGPRGSWRGGNDAESARLLHGQSRGERPLEPRPAEASHGSALA